jgi:dTDP-4-amino-4,6-dideoxygalactose transaminase
MAYLNEKGIACGIHYPVPLHLQKAYAFMAKGPGSFPVAEKCASGYVSLPMFAELTDEQVAYVVEQIKGYYA